MASELPGATRFATKRQFPPDIFQGLITFFNGSIHKEIPHTGDTESLGVNSTDRKRNPQKVMCQVMVNWRPVFLKL